MRTRMRTLRIAQCWILHLVIASLSCLPQCYLRSKKAGLQEVLQIRPDPGPVPDPNPDPGNCWPKILKSFISWNKFLCGVFNQKLQYRPPWWTSKLHEKPPALKGEHPALQKHEIFSLFLLVFFALLDPDPHSHWGSQIQPTKSITDHCGSRSTTLVARTPEYLKRDMRGAEDSGECGYSGSSHSHTSVLNTTRDQ
jgi:hypothetical protein